MSGLKFTGERFLPSEHGEIAYEHYHRYASCLDAARGKVVLDIASGEGFGSALLARTAKKVIGVDVDRAAVRHAKQNYGHLKNVSYRTGDCRSIPLRANSIDLVVSFETIEHIQEHEAFVDEIRRVLRPKGALIISSPDKENYSERPARENPFHLHELTHNAFVRLFEDRFECVRVFRQRLAIASFLLADKADGSGELQSFMTGNRGAAPGLRPLRASLYSIAVCAQRADAIPPVRSSIHLDPEDDL